METAKIRMKVGDNEFEAEGTPEAVQAQLETFKSLLGRVEVKLPAQEPPVTPEALKNTGDNPHVPLERIMRVQGRVVSLTVLPSDEATAALLILLGNKDLRDNESVTGAEISDGLAQSGLQVARVDRVMAKLIEDQLVLKSGFRRATRYRLSNPGHQKAVSVSRELVASLPK